MLTIKLKIKSLYQVIKLANSVLLVLFVIFLFYLGYFLQQNIYLALGKIEKINSLESGEFYFAEIQTNLYQQNEKNLTAKRLGSGIDFASLADPYQPY